MINWFTSNWIEISVVIAVFYIAVSIIEGIVSKRRSKKQEDKKLSEVANVTEPANK